MIPVDDHAASRHTEHRAPFFVVAAMNATTMSLKPTAPFVPQIRLYQNWLHQQRGLTFDSYDALWRWSITDLPAFWQSIWDYFDLQSPTPHTAVLRDSGMPGAVWFEGAQFNYVHQVFRHVAPAQAAGMAAIISHNEASLGHCAASELSWPELRRQVASLALHLRAQGVQPGDRVAAYLPNVPQAMLAFLAVASIGAVWSICAPDMGTAAVLDRFTQIAPVVLIGCDAVRYGGRELDRMAVMQALCAALPSLRHVVLLRQSSTGAGSHDEVQTPSLIAVGADFTSATARNDDHTEAFEPLWLPFNHPLWIVYSSGTTGLPKAIVHGHGGTVIVALALKVLHNDIGCSYAGNSFGERYHWYSSTGWVMWNAQMSGLLNGTTCCLYDGNPAGRTTDAAGHHQPPDWATLWRFAAELGVTFFGAGAAFFANCMKAGLDLTQFPGLATVRALGCTGSPLSAQTQEWGTEQFARIQAATLREIARPAADSEPHEMGEHGGNIEGMFSRRAAPRENAAPSGGSEPHAVGERGGNIEGMFSRRAAPRENATPSGGRELHEVNDRGGMFSEGPLPRENATPSGGRALHEVSNRGGYLDGSR